MSYLSVLEGQARKRNTKTQQQSHRGLEDLKATVDSLTIQRDQLKAEIAGHNIVSKNIKRWIPPVPDLLKAEICSQHILN